MKRVPCPECAGTGEVEEYDESLTCSDCDGTGEIEVEDDD